MHEEFNFGGALDFLRAGKKVAREGWNGKGMFVYLVESTVVPTEHLRGACKAAVEKVHKGAFDKQVICGHIDMMAADGTVVVGWLASQTDMLADDWVIVE